MPEEQLLDRLVSLMSEFHSEKLWYCVIALAAFILLGLWCSVWKKAKKKDFPFLKKR